MEELAAGRITTESGLEGDHKGAKFKDRQITAISLEQWQSALEALALLEGGATPKLDWTVRRANLLVQGVRLPRARGGIVRVGPVKLEITGPTLPCSRMEEAYAGLLKALHPEWRGGITARVLEGGDVSVGDEVEVLLCPPEKTIRLPG